jgi:hypothetical protein
VQHSKIARRRQTRSIRIVQVKTKRRLRGGHEPQRFTLPGQATRTIKAGDGFQIPPDTPHAGGKPGSAKSVILITYVVEKGKPLASPA